MLKPNTILSNITILYRLNALHLHCIKSIKTSKAVFSIIAETTCMHVQLYRLLYNQQCLGHTWMQESNV